jgi:hypothetical protein
MRFRPAKEHGVPPRSIAHLRYDAPELRLVPVVTNPVMDNAAEGMHFGLRKLTKLLDFVD